MHEQARFDHAFARIVDRLVADDALLARLPGAERSRHPSLVASLFGLAASFAAVLVLDVVAEAVHHVAGPAGSPARR